MPISGGAYVRLSQTGIGSRREMALIHDTARSRFVLAGGMQRGAPYLTDGATWAFDLAGPATWTELGPPIRGTNVRSRGFVPPA